MYMIDSPIKASDSHLVYYCDRFHKCCWATSSSECSQPFKHERSQKKECLSKNIAKFKHNYY